MEDKNHVISKSELQRLANDVQLDDQVVEVLFIWCCTSL